MCEMAAIKNYLFDDDLLQILEKKIMSCHNKLIKLDLINILEYLQLVQSKLSKEFYRFMFDSIITASRKEGLTGGELVQILPYF